MKVAELFIRKVFSKDNFPQLHSKRGFERNRIKFNISIDRDELFYITDNKGNKLDIEL